MAERRRSAHAIDDQNNGRWVSAKKPRDPQSSYLYRSVRTTHTSARVTAINMHYAPECPKKCIVIKIYIYIFLKKH